MSIIKSYLWDKLASHEAMLIQNSFKNHNDHESRVSSQLKFGAGPRYSQLQSPTRKKLFLTKSLNSNIWFIISLYTVYCTLCILFCILYYLRKSKGWNKVLWRHHCREWLNQKKCNRNTTQSKIVQKSKLIVYNNSLLKVGSTVDYGLFS